MNTSRNKEVQDFLEDMMTKDDTKFEILQALRKIILDLDESIKERIIYGGIMFSGESDIGGIFPSKKHISFEFGNGYQFDDPEKLLEWTGKIRRHLKIHGHGDIQDKNIEFFVKQALK